MMRLPLLPTVFVAAAVAVMIGLGVWQLGRAQEKEALLDRYAAARGLPPIALPLRPDPENPPLFRTASADCAGVTGWRAVSGRNRAGESGYVHVAACTRAGGGPGFQAVMGWSKDPRPPVWAGGPVTGQLGPDRDHVVRLYAESAAPGLVPASPPTIDDIPNNHRAYAAQWFFFAAAAAAIYALALRRRAREG